MGNAFMIGIIGIEIGNEYHEKNKCCCYCLSVESGVRFVTFGLMLSAASEFISFNPFRLFFKALLLLFFLIMHFGFTCCSSMFENDFDRKHIAKCAWIAFVPCIGLINIVMHGNLLLDNALLTKEICYVLGKHSLSGSDC